MLFHVALLSPPYNTFTYENPSWLPDHVWALGMRVAVPLGNSSYRAGIITKMNVEESPKGLRAMIWPLETQSLLDEEYIDIIQQLGVRQVEREGRILANVLPQTLREIKNIRIRQFHQANEGKKPRVYKIRDLKELILEELEKLGEDFISGQAQILLQGEDSALSEYLLLQSNPPWSIRANAHKQREILDFIFDHGTVSRRYLMQKFPASGNALETLLRLDYIRLDTGTEREESLDEVTAQINFLPPPMPLFKLLEEQQNVVDSILVKLDKKESGNFLLFGITGSGKTAIYLELAQRSLEQGRSVLLLAPEVSIALKLQQDALARNMPVLLSHGYQNPKIRGKTFLSLANDTSGEPKLIVGTRSALFLPIKNLGLVILDEEHDDSYKQEETFSYHAKDIALYRARKSNAICLMASATPDVKTFYEAQKTNSILRLEKRVGGGKLPEIKLVDISSCSTPFASASIIALKETLAKGEQAIIMLNRRGFSPVMYCLDCGKVARCHNCDITLTYHRKREQLKCHYCGYSKPHPSPCTHCNSVQFLPMGEGTERLEDELYKLVPASKILRLDRDTTRKEGSMEEVLNAFARQDAQVLVGTQMLSKGHHFPNVTLALVVDGDLGLNFPDYRATERTFQLLVQASGRAGRGEKPGQVLIQTRDVNHYCWQYIKNTDYMAFYEQEIALRQKRKYPPFVKLALIRASWPLSMPEYIKLWTEFVEKVREIGSQELQILGPNPAPIAFVNGRSRFQCLIKGKDWISIRNAYRQSYHQVFGRNISQDLRISLDIDPVNML